MDFTFSKQQLDIKRAAREFAEKEFPKVAKECDLNEEFPFKVWKKACELGMIGCFIPEKYDGPGLGITEHCCIAEEFWRVDPGCGQCMISTVIGAEFILMFGNEGPQYPKIEVYGEEIIEKIVKPSGNSRRIYLPPSWIGRHVKIIKVED